MILIVMKARIDMTQQTHRHRCLAVIALTLLGLTLPACTENKTTNNDELAVSQKANNVAPNILLIIGDDMGNESLPCYDLNDNSPNTAALNALCNEGVRFTNFWSQPVCSPTRATMITGRYGFRTGVGGPTGNGLAQGYLPPVTKRPADAARPIRHNRKKGKLNTTPSNTNWGLLSNEFTLPMAFRANQQLGYSTAMIGKWHLADTRNGWEQHANRVGFDYVSGLVRGTVADYYAWPKAINGKQFISENYAPTDKVDDAITWIHQQNNPWFLWLAFNLPHSPLQLPPKDLMQPGRRELDPNATTTDKPIEYFDTMMETMDAQISRLLASLDPAVRKNTYVIFMGDNGTSDRVVRPPFEPGKAKGTVFQGGVNVPLIVTGPNVAKGATSQALVNSTDIFATILDMAGIDITTTAPRDVTIDSASFVPYLSHPQHKSIREWVYADKFSGSFSGIDNADYAIRNTTHKLMRHDGNEYFYHLTEDPYEHNNLLENNLTAEQKVHYTKLKDLLLQLRASR
jgi:arylsulfatase B